MKSVCIKCGSEKDVPLHACDECGCDPTDDDKSFVKSLYLSCARFVPDEERMSEYESELDEISQMIKLGREPSFDEIELRRLRELRRMMEEIRPWHVYVTLFMWFLPAVSLLAVLYLILFLLRAFLN